MSLGFTLGKRESTRSLFFFSGGGDQLLFDKRQQFVGIYLCGDPFGYALGKERRQFVGEQADMIG